MLEWELVAIVMGSAGLGGVISAVATAITNRKRLPDELQGLKLEAQLTLSEAATNLVQSQGGVVAARDAEVQVLTERVDKMAQTLERVLDDLENERQLRELREHELEQQRIIIAKLEQQVRSHTARIAALKRYLRGLGHDPDAVEIEEDIEEDER